MQKKIEAEKISVSMGFFYFFKVLRVGIHQVPAFLVALAIWGVLKLVSPLELLTNLKKIAEFPEALIAVVLFFN